ncbi:helix-hairpin-helix domain-containing protein [Oxalobacteraceae bacterium R-40]|uniref:Helix-hairpin-helix domain-containing protein n=1 Tax=Keguizhuia sedimenti TaxID=3064264 RepID=A0ABU1BUZ7_9BURK|nr:helix-hairpin-helix domain-containing protein [Oxalobacteraceae bacterium R-40]
MFKKIMFAIAAFAATAGIAFAAVDLNKADQAALDSVKGIGPKMSKAILDERKKGGEFKDWEDFGKRVKGIGDKNSDKFSQEGVTINGKSKSNAGSKKDTKEVKSAAKEMKKDAKAEAKDMKAGSKAAAKDAKQEAKEVEKDAKTDPKEAKK